MYSPGRVQSQDVQAELEAVSRETETPTVIYLKLTQLNAAIAKPEDGMLVYADGTNWNPGSGEGIYAYYNSTWNKL